MALRRAPLGARMDGRGGGVAPDCAIHALPPHRRHAYACACTYAPARLLVRPPGGSWRPAPEAQATSSRSHHAITPPPNNMSPPSHRPARASEGFAGTPLAGCIEPLAPFTPRPVEQGRRLPTHLHVVPVARDTHDPAGSRVKTHASYRSMPMLARAAGASAAACCHLWHRRATYAAAPQPQRHVLPPHAPTAATRLPPGRHAPRRRHAPYTLRRTLLRCGRGHRVRRDGPRGGGGGVG